VTRDELLKLFDAQCRAGADLQLAADRIEKERDAVIMRFDAAWEAISNNERDRRRTMHRVLEVSMGKADPGPREAAPPQHSVKP
jgi:hypothetical protein